MGDGARINGNEYAWDSISLKIDGEPFYGFTAINYGDKRERTKSYGMGRHHAPRGRTGGKYTVDPVKLTGPKATFQAVRAALAAKSPDRQSYGNVPCQIVVQFVEQDGTPITDELIDCVWVSNSSSHEESADPLKEEVEFDCMYIKRSGLTLFDNSDGTR